MPRFTTPRGNSAVMECRPDTNDEMVCYSILTEDEYGFRPLHLTGTALDIGAHIGAATVALALDNPELRVIAVEPVPDNIILLARNVEANGLSDRVSIIEGAAGRGPQRVGWDFRARKKADITAASMHRYIGNQRMPKGTRAAEITVPGYTLAKLVKLAGGAVSLVKIDCEGCEHGWFSGPALEHVERIHGEVHQGPRAAVYTDKAAFLAALS